MRLIYCVFSASFVFCLFIEKLVGEEDDLESGGKSIFDENKMAMEKVLGRSLYNPMGIFDIEIEDVRFYFYNSESYEGGIPFDRTNVSTALRPFWGAGAPLKIITHGWRSSEFSDAVTHIRQAYLKSSSLNIVTVDWSGLASSIIYPIAAVQTYQVGTKIGEMIDEMVYKRMVTLDQIHIIGHSLGAHVAGSAGANTKTGKVYRITGLDPAMPGFEGIQPRGSRLDASDADFVDVIHTAAGTAGYYSSIGHADFYPNGGTPPQPGCMESPLDFQATFACSHFRAHQYYTESIYSDQEKFKAHPSESYRAYSNGDYNSSVFSYMGHHSPVSSRGVYYLKAAFKSNE